MSEPTPPKLPVELRRFVPTEWGAEPESALTHEVFRRAHGRWTRARLAWARAHQVNPKDLPKTGPQPFPVTRNVIEG